MAWEFLGLLPKTFKAGVQTYSILSKKERHGKVCLVYEGDIFKQTYVQNNLLTYMYKLIGELIKSMQPLQLFSKTVGAGGWVVSGFVKPLVYENMNFCKSVSIYHVSIKL